MAEVCEDSNDHTLVIVEEDSDSLDGGTERSCSVNQTENLQDTALDTTNIKDILVEEKVDSAGENVAKSGHASLHSDEFCSELRAAAVVPKSENECEETYLEQRDHTYISKKSRILNREQNEVKQVANSSQSGTFEAESVVFNDSCPGVITIEPSTETLGPYDDPRERDSNDYESEHKIQTRSRGRRWTGKYLQVTGRKSQSSAIDPASLPKLQSRTQLDDTARQGTVWKAEELNKLRTFELEPEVATEGREVRIGGEIPLPSYTFPVPRYMASTISVPLKQRLPGASQGGSAVILMPRYTANQRKLSRSRQHVKNIRRSSSTLGTDMKLYEEWCKSAATERLSQGYSQLVNSAGFDKLNNVLLQTMDLPASDNETIRVTQEDNENLQEKTSQIVEKIMQENRNKAAEGTKRNVREFEPYQPLALRAEQPAVSSESAYKRGSTTSTDDFVFFDAPNTNNTLTEERSAGKSVPNSRTVGCRETGLLEIIHEKQKYVEHLVKPSQSGDDSQDSGEWIRGRKKRNHVTIKLEPGESRYADVITIEPAPKLPRTQTKVSFDIRNIRKELQEGDSCKLLGKSGKKQKKSIVSGKLSDILSRKLKYVEKLTSKQSYSNSNDGSVAITSVKGTKKRVTEGVKIKQEPVDEGYARARLTQASLPVVEPLMKIESIAERLTVEKPSTDSESTWSCEEDEMIQAEQPQGHEETEATPRQLYRNIANCNGDTPGNEKKCKYTVRAKVLTDVSSRCHFYGITDCRLNWLHRSKPLEIATPQRYMEALFNLTYRKSKSVLWRWKLVLTFAQLDQRLLECSGQGETIYVCKRHYAGLHLDKPYVCGVCSHKTTVDEFLRIITDRSKWLQEKLASDHHANIAAVTVAFYMIHGQPATSVGEDLCWACLEKLLSCHLCKVHPETTACLATVQERMAAQGGNIGSYCLEEIPFNNIKREHALNGRITKSTLVCDACYDVMKCDLDEHKSH